MTTLPEPSPEQWEIINSLENNNLIVDSVAGSGKTTLNLHLAQQFETLEILLLTYNARLKEETRYKAIQLGLNNLEIHSYHSFAVKYLNPNAYTDQELKKSLDISKIPKKMPYYDLIIIDEAQDLTPLYYKLVVLLYYSNPLHIEKGTRLCIVGDKYQSIYGFQDADPRMITLANYHFNFNQTPWHLAKLSTSFRVSTEISNFINNCCLRYQRLVGAKSTGNLPRYIICDSFCDNLPNKKTGTISTRPKNSTVWREFEYYQSLGYRPEDFFILAPSIRSAASPARQLANRMTKDEVPVFVPFSDDEKIDEKVISGKVVFSSFHQVKGLERPVVMVFNFDESYFKFYGQNLDPNQCPNEIYVALTRSLEHLSIFHHYQNDYLPFLAKHRLKTYTNIITSRPVKPSNTNRPRPLIRTSVTDLIRHLPLDVISNVNNFFAIKPVRKIGQKINIPHVVSTPSGFENVSDINGTAIPAYFEYLNRKTMSIYREESLRQSNIFKSPSNSGGTAVSCLLDGNKQMAIPESLILDSGKGNGLTVAKLLKIANHWNSFTSGYLFKLRQITNYNWMTRDQLKLCKDRLTSLGISKTAQYEKQVELHGRPELNNRHIVGFLDLISDQNIYEFKCVERLQTEHYLQLAIYTYLFLATKPKELHGQYHFFLYNILTDQLDELVSNFDKLTEMMAFLIRSKYFANTKLNDNEFLAKVQKTKATITTSN